MNIIEEAVEKLPYIKHYCNVLKNTSSWSKYINIGIHYYMAFYRRFLNLAGYEFKIDGDLYTPSLDTLYKGELTNTRRIRYDLVREESEAMIECLIELNEALSERFVNPLPKREGYFFPTTEST